MAKAKKRSRSRRRRQVYCPTSHRLGRFNPNTGRKYKSEMCVPTSPAGKVTAPKVVPKQKPVAIDCPSGSQFYPRNPNTGKASPTCVRTLKSGKVKTTRPHVGKKSRASAVKIERIIAIQGRR